MFETKVKQDDRWEEECEVETIKLDDDEVIIGVRGDHSTEYKGRKGYWRNLEFLIGRK